jgi:hypothetical protein
VSWLVPTDGREHQNHPAPDLPLAGNLGCSRQFVKTESALCCGLASGGCVHADVVLRTTAEHDMPLTSNVQTMHIPQGWINDSSTISAEHRPFREQVEAQGSTNYAAIRPAHVLWYEIPSALDPRPRICGSAMIVAEKTRRT